MVPWRGVIESHPVALRLKFSQHWSGPIFVELLLLENLLENSFAVGVYLLLWTREQQQQRQARGEGVLPFFEVNLP